MDTEHASPRTITPEQLDAHRRWQRGEEGGQRLNLRGADLYGANLYGADLRGANLYGADLYGADLRGANLYGANLRDADLRGANLYGADLYGADLRGANLRGANLRGANLERTCVRLILADDGRGYQVVAHRGVTSDGEPLYVTGCRKLSAVGAEKHWGDPNHPNPAAAAQILSAIRADMEAGA